MGLALMLSCSKEKGALTISNPRVISSTYSGDVPEIPTLEEARLIAERLNETKLLNPDAEVGIREIVNAYEIPTEAGLPLAYVFNYLDGGFSIIGADYRFEPILALTNDGSLSINDTILPVIGEWFGYTLEQIENIRNNTVIDTSSYPYARSRWDNTVGMLQLQPHQFIHPSQFVSPPYNPCNNWNTVSKLPLLTTNWGQWNTYNNLIPPTVSSSATQCIPPTGCVATTMAQLIRYWQPTNIFSYNYAIMPNDNGNNEVQRLMRDAGTSVSMNYSCTESAANSDDVGAALENTFGFISGGTYQDYTGSSKWDVLTDLDKNQPVYVAANEGYTWAGFLFFRYRNYTGGHAWLIDGYMRHFNGCNSTIMYHMNWGSNEIWTLTNDNPNGWFYESVWNAPVVGNFQYNRRFYKNIYN